MNKHVEEIRKYRDLLESVLMEAQNYEEMFSALYKLPFQFEPPSRVIKAAKTKLKTKDKIVWFLRQWRIGLCLDILYSANKDSGSHTDVSYQTRRDNAIASLTNLLKKYYQFENNAVKDSSYLSVYRSYDMWLTTLEHLLSLPIPEIQNYKYETQIVQSTVQYFEELEKRWQNSVKEIIPYDPTDGKVIMTFPDGFFWQNLNREYCDKEGAAMGHCGNAADYQAGDQVLSLRKKVKVGNKIYVRPSLTFILDKDGYLGEMKGRANNKPEAKYHSYIVALLKSDTVKGIEGDGYAPENNFKLSDLDIGTINILLDEKPSLLDINDLMSLVNKGYKPTGEMLTEYNRLKIKKWLKNSHNFTERNPEVEQAIIKLENKSFAGEYLKRITVPHSDYPVPLQLLAVKDINYKNGSIISHIKNPSEAVQIAAVQTHSEAIRYIIKQSIIPSEAVQLAAAQQNGVFAIKYLIENGIRPSEAVQLAAVKSRHYAIKLINNPSDVVKAVAKASAEEAAQKEKQ